MRYPASEKLEIIRLVEQSPVFLENISDPRLMRQIASETGAAIGGTLYSDSLTPKDGELRATSRWSGMA
jgi:ABC-type Zn uptake system ZnuABC Zn-binding protein ZnuA